MNNKLEALQLCKQFRMQLCLDPKINSWPLHESQICEHHPLSLRIKRRLLSTQLPHNKTQLADKNRANFLSQSKQHFSPKPSKNYKKKFSRHKVEMKTERKPQAILKLVPEQSHTAADYLSYLNIFLSRTTFFYANKTCKIHERKNCPAKAEACARLTHSSFTRIRKFIRSPAKRR